MKMKSSRCRQIVVLAFVFATTLPSIRADEPSPNPAAPQNQTAQIPPPIPKPNESVTHFVMFSGPKDIVKDWMINATLLSPTKIADSTIIIEPDVVQWPPSLTAGAAPRPESSPYRVSVGGSFPAENGGYIYSISLKSYQPTSKAELEELFVKYLKAIDQKLFDYYKQIISSSRDSIEETQEKITADMNTLDRLQNQKRNMLKDVPLPPEALTESLGEIEKELLKSDIELVTITVKTNQLRKMIERNNHANKDNIDESESKEVYEFRKQLIAVVSDRTTVATKEGPDHQEVKQIDHKIDELLRNFRQSHMSKLSETDVATKLQEYVDLHEDLMQVNKKLNERRNEIRRLREIVISRTNDIVSIDEEIKETEKRMRSRRQKVHELQDRPWNSIQNRLKQNQMGMITILDPAPKPEARAEEKAPPAESKDSKPAPETKEEKKPTSPAPAESPK